jgi:hypothetical protein
VKYSNEDDVDRVVQSVRVRTDLVAGSARTWMRAGPTRPVSGRRTVAVYTIRVVGQIDEHWSSWFDGLTITNFDPGETVISGDIIDQAALHGTLNRIRNLNLALISVTRIDAEPVDPVGQTVP